MNNNVIRYLEDLSWEVRYKKCFNGRELTEQEGKFHKQGMCICCGRDVEVFANGSSKVVYWKLECAECTKLRLKRHEPSARVGHRNSGTVQFKSLMGYGNKDVV